MQSSAEVPCCGGKVYVTSQHRYMLEHVQNVFAIVRDYDVNIMQL